MSEVVDPGCESLNIRKDKPEQEIINYLSKDHRKRYKFVLGWLEGTNEEGDEILKELVEDAGERRKIYGWQN